MERLKSREVKATWVFRAQHSPKPCVLSLGLPLSIMSSFSTRLCSVCKQGLGGHCLQCQLTLNILKLPQNYVNRIQYLTPIIGFNGSCLCFYKKINLVQGLHTVVLYDFKTWFYRCHLVFLKIYLMVWLMSMRVGVGRGLSLAPASSRMEDWCLSDKGHKESSPESCGPIFFLACIT